MTESPKRLCKRLCVGCRNLIERQSLIRITKDFMSGEVVINSPGLKIFGRSAYLCKNLACLEQAKKKNRLRNSLSGKRKSKSEKSLSSQNIKNLEIAPQVIKAIADLCADPVKTCQNTLE